MVWNKGFAQFAFLGPARPQLVALMHLSSGRREDELQGFASLREMVFGVVEKIVSSSDLKNISSAPSHHCIFGMLFSLVLPLQFEWLVIGHFLLRDISSLEGRFFGVFLFVVFVFSFKLQIKLTLE